MSETSETPQAPEVLERMLAMWNERDPLQVRGYVDSVLSEDVIFIDPSNSITGRDAFEEMVKKFRAGAPEAVCRRASGVDGHHGLYRYHWEIHQGETLLIEGFDVAQIDASGQVCRVEGFFGRLLKGGPTPQA